jgi:hypothetical protein
MKTPLPSSANYSRCIVVSQSDSRITNVAAKLYLSELDVKPSPWSPASIYLSKSTGALGLSVRLATSLFQASKYVCYGWYHTSKDLLVTPPLACSAKEGDYVYLEVDLDPKTSQVTFWVNDRGADMGVLRGFEGGAQKASWAAGTKFKTTQLMNAKFADCAYATAEGWKASAFTSDDILRRKAKVHDLVMVSSTGITFGDKRFVA